ncbi:MAG: YidC/Oxa1 family membrane protein insertase [[Clostridium] aminophilum]|uniref:YidC/Oxa1 family membrane protein insertase n=1 Tax=[Clostridium] aminophilum TaxID=1526 RepID=UPI0026EBDD57|nr:YidC/Oxa1 family membrane protein insertase [[Clostridium] aminophilum]MDD6197430.1 YidC/Oxa1 family membrane protein insertase [[Clostridium] aminophilum]
MSVSAILYTLLIKPLELFFEIIFVTANRFTNHPGLSIIVLSLTMNFLVLPLYRRADAVQAEERDIEKKLHRGVAHIKKVFHGDERMMVLQTYYRQNNYKPTDAFKGSVSLFLEIPFFIAAYRFLSGLQILHGVSFGPIADLGNADGLITIGAFSHPVNLLPIIMTAVNLISCVIFTKGYPVRTKVQLYAMAVFFLFFLYTSPSGLVFYWTLNNLFSLVKTIFYKLKHPREVLAVLFAVCGAALAVYGLLFFDNIPERQIVTAGIGVGFMMPLFRMAFELRFAEKRRECAAFAERSRWAKSAEPNAVRFRLCGLFLTMLLGGHIPSGVIAASPQEFVSMFSYYNPLLYIAISLLTAAGFFLIWMGVFYGIANREGKLVLERILAVFCAAATVNYMVFPGDYGNLSNSLRYEEVPNILMPDIFLNLAAVIAAGAVILVFLHWRKTEKHVSAGILTGVIALSVMTVNHGHIIMKSTQSLQTNAIRATGSDPVLPLSKTGKNVIVFMLDRALGTHIPYLMQEKPELKEQFAGFTYYENTVSFGGHTNFGAPAIFGGYEYTPAELNKRDRESLCDKHNEALRVLPVMFEKAGFDVTVTDPPYANYQWSSDVSIYDDYPDIHAYITQGKFSDHSGAERVRADNQRNFFLYALMKSSPLFARTYLYNAGKYNQAPGVKYTASEDEGQVIYGTSKQEGVNQTFMDSFKVLQKLPEITEIVGTEGGRNTESGFGNTGTGAGTFLMMQNDSPHNSVLLQEPDYTVSSSVDNTAYDKVHRNRFSMNGRKMEVKGSLQYGDYEANMGVMLELGKWFDYLREQGVYDNTKIILVSDHGFGRKRFPQLLLDGYDTYKGSENIYDAEYYCPLLMVKDFGAKEFTTDRTFMTNADAAVLAVKDVIADPVNPFTGKEITDAEKTAHPQYILASNHYDVNVNDGTQFMPDTWISVKDDIWNPENWNVLNHEAVFPEK